METKLTVALEEAWDKANDALSETTEQKTGFEKKIWAAAEAAEYTSLLFSLTYGLEDVDPPVSNKRGEGRLSLLKESVDSLKRLREKDNREPSQQYAVLRKVSLNLRAAYLQGLTRGAKV